MKLLSIEFVPNWSWGLIFKNFDMKKFKVKRIFINMQEKFEDKTPDVILSQNVTLLKKFTARLKTVCRMGGNYNFTDLENSKGLENLLREMSKCYCLIATNQKLYEIGKSVNPNTVLLPNGLDLIEWKYCYNPNKKIVAGFCGNISSQMYRDYKGYDVALNACDNMGIKLTTALYKDKQIPHDKMQELFYSKIDVLIHPTKGEGCSNTLMEALASGIPIITTRSAGFHSEMLEQYENVLFCDRRARGIQDCLLDLMKSNELREKLSVKGRLFAEKYHDVNNISKKYEEILLNCYKFNNKI